jgi:hypothetical protein
MIKIDASKPGFIVFNFGTKQTIDKLKYSDYKIDDFQIKTKDISYNIHGCNWDINVTRKPIYNSLTNGLKWRLDMRIQPIDRRFKTYPHGIIGQSFDDSKLAINGNTDDYSNKRYVKTEAQAEGAIEGSFKDYIMNNVQSPDFKYSRFYVTEEMLPRNVNTLTGKHTVIFKDSLVAGSDDGFIFK